ncbi:MAG TPA: hypothetical protein VG458_05715 [Solirubrobacterales bacterium]|nr:hypothetical protein [Solirubrobacterales bacterium]
MARLCAERGYEATTLADVAAGADVAVAEVEALFGEDREECLLAAVHVVMGETIAAMSGAYSEDLAEADSILAGALAILELMAARPSYAKLAYIVSRHMAPPRVREAHEAATQALLVMMERLRQYSTVDTQPLGATRAALGSAETVVRVAIARGGVEELPLLLAPLTYGAMVPFLGQAEALRLARRANLLVQGTNQGVEKWP